MPELPEVETIVRALQRGGRGEPAIAGRTILKAHILWDKTIANPSSSEFVKIIKGRKIIEVSRKGKFIIFKLDRGYLLFHLRMSGDLCVEQARDENGKQVKLRPHDRLALDFTDGWRVVFNDTRKFGRAWLVPELSNVTDDLGPDPFDGELNHNGLYGLLQKKNRQIKPLLLDQSFLAGVGNIYADESLNLAKIHPLKKASDLTPEESESLLKSLRTVLRKGIRHNGASIDWVYRGGGFQNHFRVYQRTGQPCPECGTAIQRITVGQRGTHFCPNCQKLG